MLSLPLPVRIFLCTHHVDLRKSFDGLAQLVREFLDVDPMSGHLFVFRNKRADRLKLLYWDSDGYMSFPSGERHPGDLRCVAGSRGEAIRTWAWLTQRFDAISSVRL